MSESSKVLYTRWEHGNKPVVVREHPENGVSYLYEGTEYTSARSLLRAVVGRHYHHTFDQYFYLDVEEPAEDRTTLVDLLGAKKDDLQTREDQLIKDLIASFEENEELFAPNQGVNLQDRGHEVRKLLFKSFWSHMKARDYDPDDVLQEIYKGILARNSGVCPWDEDKGKFGYYVTMVCRGVLYNYHDRESRRSSREETVEVGETFVVPDESGDSFAEGSDAQAQERLRRWLVQHHGGTEVGLFAPKMLPYLLGGYTHKEVAEQFNTTRYVVSKVAAHIRHWSNEWAQQIGLR